MNELIIKYHNLNMEKINLKKNNENDKKISLLPLIKITDNSELLQNTIKLTNDFSKNKKTFYIFGTGGSNLGSRALLDVLQGKLKNNISFYDNIDPINFKNSFENIKLDQSGFIIISKSGSTSETLSQFLCLINIFSQKKQIDEFFSKCLIITEDKKSPLNEIAIKNKCLLLHHETNIGGRFSVFSNVGMVPAILAGLKVEDIHKGTKNISNKIISENSFNHHMLFAKLLTNSNIKNNIKINVLMTYSDSLKHYGKWFLQLWSESIGKNNKALTPFHAVGTTDQHSQLQLYLDGPKDKFFTFITTNHSKFGLKMDSNILNNDETSYLSGKYMGDLMQAEQQATLDTFIKNKIPFREIFIPIINEFSIGQLMTLNIYETINACNTLDIDPFNQPAVEQGKILTKKYLS